MRATNFTVRNGIYFVAGDLQLDIHNDYDFTRFSYDVAARRLSLHWQRSVRKGVKIDQPTFVTLEIQEVQCLELKPRDAAVPFTEDDCLNDVAFLSDEEWGREPFLPAGPPDDSWRWCFSFMSGAAIVVAAASATLSFGA